jgi:guanyl-specific ribonuclease Sa
MAGVDSQNQFPNSAMARAVKLGQSRFVSADVPSTPMGEQNNVNIAAATALTVPAAIAAGLPGEGLRPTYAVITATGGPLYYTTDGTVPSATNNAGQIATGSAAPFYGLELLLALRVIGTTMNVGYYR